MRKAPSEDPRLAIIRCNPESDAGFAERAAAALSGRILLALCPVSGSQPAAVRGYDFFLLQEHGAEPGDFSALLAAANVTAGQATVVCDHNDLAQLLRILPQPVRYRVLVTSPDEETGEAFSSWIMEEHAPELLGLPGCSEFRVCKVSVKELACEYLFTSENALKTYYRDFAEAMRGRYKLKFPTADIRFTREEATMAGCGFKRDAADYSFR